MLLILFVFSFAISAISSLHPCPNVGKLKADPKNCHDFFQCTNTGWQQLHCPSDLVFNEDISVCDWPKAGTKCGNHDHGGDNDSQLDPCKYEGQKKADTKHCDLFYKCSSCGWSLVKCPAGELFNPKALVCEKSERVKCAGDDEPPLGPCDEISKLIPDPKNCNKFYECTTYGWQIMPCPSTLFFNPDTSKCDYTYNVKCVEK